MIVEERNILIQQLQKKEDVEKKLTEACTKSKSDLKQVQDKLDKAIQERGTLERKLEMAKKEVEKVQDFHNKETERLKNAKSKSESVSQQIQSKLERVIEERTRLEKQLAEIKQEVAKVPDLQKENEKIKIAHDKFEDDIKQMDEKLGRIMQEKIILEQRLENTEKELVCVQDLYKEAKEKGEKLIAKEKRGSKVEAKPIGGTKYIGEKEKVTDRNTAQIP
ncbi:tropomyosin beta chain-like [Ptychodera flava]|uniref:tropomyosin beta chain-like n=1 Tax=Ptychodera flava TaxID=63121 RepID=UPI00396A8FF6